eukprot:TRINITY_DN5208_c0_g1_i3.p1 TRINITY_DN5208_c0_g1~~TRINITY_DN5208_c0_g1_i3.p1  ORF type:complete len:468 (+),score=121.97 TRINITY_DN5208_c0_g1_i3:118-1404(+)
MLRSLVGSEMCIRDRFALALVLHATLMVPAITRSSSGSNDRLASTQNGARGETGDLASKNAALASALSASQAKLKELEDRLAGAEKVAMGVGTVKKRRTVAVAVTVSRYVTWDRKFISGGAGSLQFRTMLMMVAESIREVSARSDWDMVPVALCSQEVAPAAQAELGLIGFRVVVVPPVVTEEEVVRHGTATEDFIKDIRKEYTFGGVLRDFTKLQGMRLTQFDRVLVMDADLILLQPIDDVLEQMGDKVLASTLDFSMMEDYNRFAPVQSGFLLFNPGKAAEHFPKIQQVILDGNWTSGGMPGGWSNSGIGLCYGGSTTAGVLAYYFFQLLPSTQMGQTLWDYISVEPASNDPTKDRAQLVLDQVAPDGLDWRIGLDVWNQRGPGSEWVVLLQESEHNVFTRRACTPRGSPEEQEQVFRRTREASWR